MGQTYTNSCWLVSLFLFLLPFISPCIAQNQEEPRPGPTSFSQPPATTDDAKSQMRQMLKDDYTYWTGGYDRKLTVAEIGKLQRDKHVTGAQAALLGSLALMLDWAHGLVDRLSYDELLELADGKTIFAKTTARFQRANEDRPDTRKFRYWVSEYMHEFSSMASNATSQGLALWGKYDGPTVQAIRQGQIGDCFWVSAIEAVALKRPEVIKRTVRQIGPDTFELRFAGRENDEPMKVTVTEGDLAQFNLDKDAGCWLTALALGEARIMNANPKKNKFYRETALGVLNKGGSQCQVLHLLTGHKYGSIVFRKTTERRVNEVLCEAMQKDIPVGLTSTDHTLSIQSYDPDTRTVTILNPWGSSDKYKIPGSDMHVKMDKGVFQLSLSDVCRYFRTLNVPGRFLGS